MNTQPGYDPHKYLHAEDITISDETKQLVSQAGEIYHQNFNGKTWYGRCIFISWYCSLDDCSFCFRSVDKFKSLHPEGSRRSIGSILIEALFSRIYGWRIEFLTGGYGIMPFEDLQEVIKVVSAVYQEKIWLNLGVMPQVNIEKLRPYVKGIVSSIETANPILHKEVCPSKPIAPYERMFENMSGMKKSVAIIVGLGEEVSEIKHLFEMIEKHKVDRITIYALKPVRGTIYTDGPSVDEYLQWISRLRIRFPKLEIIAGTNLRRCEELDWVMKAGVNAFTKFPVTKQFATEKAKLLKKMVEDNNREFTSNFTEYQDLDWDAEIDSLNIEDKYKDQMKEKIGPYLKKFQKPLDKDKKYLNVIQ